MVSSDGLPEPSQPLFAFRGFTLTPVYRRTTPGIRDEVVAFWFEQSTLRESCLAYRRSQELVYLARGPDGQIAGTTSVSLGRRTREGLNVYDFRIFIARPHRQPVLARELMSRSRDLLRLDSLTHPAAGIRLFAEDPKLKRPGIRRYLERQGYRYRGPDRKGQDIWYSPFDT